MALEVWPRLRVNQILQHLFVVIFLILHCSHALTRETETAMRDFSKLRLEKRIPLRASELPIPILTPFPGNDLQPQGNDEGQYGETMSGTEDMGVEFKPSYPDSTNPSNHQNPSQHSPHFGDTRGNNSPPEDYPEPGVGGFFPPTTQQNPNSHRPLFGGPGLEEDNSSVGMGIGPSGYGDKNQNQKMEASNNLPTSNDEEGGEGDDQQENNYPETGIENGGEGVGRGYGGLFDGPYSNEADDENEQNPEGSGSYYGGGGHPPPGEGGHGGSQGSTHQGLYDPEELSELAREEGSRGYNSPGGGQIGPRGSTTDDYGDY